MTGDTGQQSGGGASTGDGGAAGDERISLALVPRESLRRRAAGVGVAGLIIGAAAGGLVGFFAGRVVGLIVAAVIALPILLLAFVEGRRSAWLSGGVVAMRTLRTRRVDVRSATRIDLLITKVRGRVTVSMVVAGPPAGRRLTLGLATYEGAGGIELGILALRRLADALASAEDTRALVFSQLLVAALRAEARGEPSQERPLHRLAALAPDGKWGQQVKQESLSAFVASLP